KLAEAQKHFRKAIDLNPRFALALGNLGRMLERQGKPGEALPLYRKALAINPKTAWIRARVPITARLAALEPKLPALLKDEFRPGSNAERLVLANLCKTKRLYRASAGLYADAFAADAKAADDLKAAHRYSAACCAALAGCGKGEDAAKLD